MGDIKLFAKNEKELKTLIHSQRIYSQDIWMESGWEKYVVLIMNNGKTKHEGRNAKNSTEVSRGGTEWLWS